MKNEEDALENMKNEEVMTQVSVMSHWQQGEPVLLEWGTLKEKEVCEEVAGVPFWIP